MLRDLEHEPDLVALHCGDEAGWDWSENAALGEESRGDGNSRVSIAPGVRRVPSRADMMGGSSPSNCTSTTATGGRVRRRRGGEPAREGGLRFDNTARDGALRLAHFRKAPGQPRPGNPGRGGPKSLPGEASGDTRETSHGDDVTEISTSPRGVLARPTLRSVGARNAGSFTRSSSDPCASAAGAV